MKPGGVIYLEALSIADKLMKDATHRNLDMFLREQRFCEGRSWDFKLERGWRGSTLTTVSIRVSKFTYRSFIHISYDSNNPDHRYRSQSMFISASGVRWLRVSFSNILFKVSCLFPFLRGLSMLFKKLLFVEYPIFGDEGIQRILLLGYRLCGWFTSSYRLCLVLPWKRRGSNVGRRWYQWALSQSYIPRPSPSWFPRTEENNGVTSSRSTPNNTTNLFATTFPNDHSQQQQQQLALGLIQTHSQSLFCLIRNRNGNAGSREESMITRDYNCRRLLLAVPTVD